LLPTPNEDFAVVIPIQGVKFCSRNVITEAPSRRERYLVVGVTVPTLHGDVYPFEIDFPWSGKQTKLGHSTPWPVSERFEKVDIGDLSSGQPVGDLGIGYGRTNIVSRDLLGVTLSGEASHRRAER